MSDRRVTSDGHVRIAPTKTECTVAQLNDIKRVSDMRLIDNFEISSSGTTKRASLKQLIAFLQGN